MDIERSLRFIWEDEDWIKKVLIAAVLMITGIGGIGTAGWLAELARRVANDEDEPLPDWDDIGRYFINGLKYMAVAFIWSLPVTALIVGISLVSVFSFTQDDSSAVFGIFMFSNICIFFLTFVYIMFLTMMMMPLWVQLAEDTPFGELVNPARTWTLLRANLTGYLVVMLITWLATFVASLAGTILCGIGLIFTSVIAQIFFAHLVGQATAQARLNLENQPAVPVE